MKKDNQLLLDLAISACKKAGTVALDFRQNTFKTKTKSSVRDLVTEADIAAEKVILSMLSDCEESVFLSEETNQDFSIIQKTASDPSKILWIIDPIDGTMNYAHGHSHSAISIAAAYNNQVQVAAVYNPFNQELFTAIKGQGAYLNQQKINCIDVSTLERTLIATGLPTDRSPEMVRELVERIFRVSSTCLDIRRLGAASLDMCWVACGRLHAYYETVNSWDMAAAALIAKEAGASVGYFGERKSFNSHLEEDLYATNLLVAVPGVYQKLQELLP